MAEEEAWSDLAAVMEEAVHGQDDVRTSLARPYVLRLYARRAAEVIARCVRVFRLSARVTAAAAGAVRVGIAGVVLGGAWALATGRVDAARLTAIWLLAIAFGATVEHIARWVPHLQHAFGAWARVQLLRRVAAGAGRRGHPGRRRPDRTRAHLPLPGRRGRPRSGAARRAPRLRPRPLVRARRADRLGQVDAGQGAHPGGGRAARHGVPRRHRPGRPGRRGAAPVDRRGAAAHRDPGRHARRERRAVRPGAAATPPSGRWPSWA